MDWDAYCAWAGARLSEFEGFEARAKEVHLVRLVRYGAGDAYRVDLLREEEGPPVRLRVRFHAMAY